MDSTFQLDIEHQLVDLGDAKELTLGIPNALNPEDNPLVSGKFPS